MCFHSDESEGVGFTLQSNARFAHTYTYIQTLATMYSFEVMHIDTCILRKDFHGDVYGYVCVLKAH